MADTIDLPGPTGKKADTGNMGFGSSSI